MDVLSETIAAIRTGNPTSGMFIRHAPWGRHYPVMPGAGFHVILQGSCWLLRPDAEPVALGVGDVLLMPRGADHTLVDSLDSAVTETARPGEPREIAGTGARTALLCGAYELGRQRSHPILDDLPEFIHLPARPGRHPALRGAVDLLAAEVAEPRPGTDAAIPALLDTLLLFFLRAWFDEQAEARTAGWAGAFADPAVAAALRAMHADPGRAWTVPELGAAAGVSRATLARRFTATVGEPPLSYLTRWRLLTAACLLRDTDTPLAAVARRIGYRSEFAFAKAFKREYGLAPGQYRRAVDKPEVIAV
ncbi:AraC family transcriptional regulator [Nocardia otitidiscaviarum]|uniref:AraC family transcriptional regulator n=1 Tax=Nocardia otitidiscaviarum TaxID=1823 RepID=A0A516NT89_9NOCA|nr:AraC family transcriptional regulator [Nocardia otitidiscaviarum]MBF6179236.1 AraC family transcriptional regulator [Nocardia otitidiscaviarum]MCP9621421.1 AraC family transcriptional regulator [Nocardia otitidiscaviarum]QDP82117.1 AraC family transcriptional regulator [Nocardia otitidiscaviarum]